MSRKLDWADKEARKIAAALHETSDAGKALIASSLRLAFEKGVAAGADRTSALPKGGD